MAIAGAENAAAAAVSRANLAETLQELRDFRAWPKDDSARRKLYLRLSKSAHPDNGGSSELFEQLVNAYAEANEIYKARLETL